MKNKIFFALIILLSFPAVAWGLPFYSQTQSMVPGSDTVNNNLGTTSPSNLRYNGFFKNISVSGTCTGCTSGGAASSTLLGDTNTFSGTDKFSNPITDGTLTGLIAGNGGLTYAAATSSIGAGTGLTFSGTAGAQVGGTNGTYSVNTTQNITTLSNLSSAGTLNNTSSGVLYSTATSTPTVTAPITYSGTLGQFIGGVSGAFACTTASAGVTGCLSGTDYNTFNGKQNAIALGAGTVNSSASNALYATATTSVSSGTGISFTGTAGALIGGSSLTITNSGITSLGGLTGAVATTSLFTGITGQTAYFSGTNTLIGTSTIFTTTGSAVGVGLTNPGSKLEVMGTSTSSTGQALVVWDSASNPLLYVRNDGALAFGTTTLRYNFEFEKTQNAQTILRVRNDSNGAAALSQQLMSYGDNAQYISYGQVNPGFVASGLFQPSSSFMFTTGNTNGMRIFTFDSSNLTLGTSFTARMTITSAGTIGIGTTTAVADFQTTNANSNATSTLELGKANQNKGSCMKLYRTDGSAIYAYVAAGTTAFTLSTTACATVSGF